MKICFLVHDLNSKAGWGRYALEIIERIRTKNIEIKVFSEAESGYNCERGLLWRSMDNPFFVFWNVWKIRGFLKDCDVIHCFDGWPYGFIGALANIGLGKKLIINGVGTYSVAPLEQGIKSFLLKWAYHRADKILCISRFTCDEIKKRVPDLENLEVVNLGVDLNRFYVLENVLENQINKVIFSVGALKFRKGYHISIPAVGLARKEYPNLRYYIVGDQSNKDYFQKLQKLAEQYNLKNHIIFLENLSDEELLKLYNQADLFLLTPVNENNSFEGFGLVYLEANACGKPVIGTYGCGAEDAIIDGYNGLLVPQENIEKTAEAIIRILDNQDFTRHLSENGKKFAQKMTWEATVNKYIETYQKVIK